MKEITGGDTETTCASTAEGYGRDLCGRKHSMQEHM